jgi:L-cystine uptake protein TcyP (sodium:dicarboxylate symporter family)
LENHYARILKIETRAKEMGQSTLTAIEANCPADSFEKLQNATNTITESVSSISKLLNAVKEKIAKKDRSDATELWNRFDQESEALRKNFTNLEDLGMALLPESMLSIWKESIHKFRSNLLPYISSYAKACRIELKMIERYTMDEMNMITKIIVDKIPEDFNAEEAVAYEKDYLVALKDFKQEFSQEKNLWDTFLDILAGGAHQSPEEHVMMERWIEGEKGTL